MDPTARSFEPSDNEDLLFRLEDQIDRAGEEGDPRIPEEGRPEATGKLLTVGKRITGQPNRNGHGSPDRGCTKCIRSDVQTEPGGGLKGREKSEEEGQ